MYKFSDPDSWMKLFPYIKRFKNLILYVTTFCVDRISDPEYEELEYELKKEFGDLMDLENELESVFFSGIYVDRAERDNIVSVIPKKRTILIHGLKGVGKTTVLRKIAYDFESDNGTRFLYIDLKKFGLELSDSDINIKVFEQVIRDRLYEKYICSDDAVKSLKLFRWRKDSINTQFRMKLFEKFGHIAFDEVEKWHKIQDNSEANALYEKEQNDLSLSGLIQYLKSEGKFFVLCIDNLDVLLIKLQCAALSFAIHLSNQDSISVLISARDSNIDRMQQEGSGGDIIFMEDLGRRDKKHKRDDHIRIQQMPEVSIKNLFENIFTFITNHRQLIMDDDLIKQDVNGSIINTYLNHFWTAFTKLSNSFFSTGAYEYSNYSVRDTMLMYYNFINRMLIYDIEQKRNEIIGIIQAKSVTEIRSYFYRWLMTGNDTWPRSDKWLLNVLRQREIPYLWLRILEVLSNLKRADEERRLTIDTLHQIFSSFRVKEDVISRALMELVAIRRETSLGLIWIENVTNTDIRNDSNKVKIGKDSFVEILPAGEYFLKHISISVEYLFWCIYMVDRSDGKYIPRKISLQKSCDVAYKIETVINYVEEEMIEPLENELRSIVDDPIVPDMFSCNFGDYVRLTISDDGHFYCDRLLNSILNFYKFAQIDEGKKLELQNRTISMLRQVELLENKYILRGY